MKHSESIINISQALLKAQKEIEDPKQTAENPFFKSKYTPLVDILKLARPIYNKYGITILQDIQGVSVSTIFLHESGEWIQQDGCTLIPDKETPQAGGSAITYARRYSISAWLGIASDEDDDGNAGSKNKSGKKKLEDEFQGQDVTVEVMKMKTKDLSEYATNYFRELKYGLREVYNWCKPYKFDPVKIDEAIKKL